MNYILLLYKSKMEPPLFHTTKIGNIYLTMEPMHSRWEVYVNSANTLLSGGNDFIGTWGGILDLYKHTTINDFLATRTYPSFWTEDTKLFEHILTQIRKCDFEKTSNKYKELLSITHASSGMNVRSQTHVVYASKCPVTIPFHLRESHKPRGFAHYYDLYQDIIMSVGVTINEEVVENRGIFRNPLSIISNDHRGIAMFLHTFTCRMVHQYFPQVSIFSVRPMEKMAQILFTTLPKGNLTIDGKKADDYDGDFICERRFMIPIIDLLVR